MKLNYISDKRKVKLVIYEVQDVNEDIALQEIVHFKLGKVSIKFDTPNLTAMHLNASELELKLAKAIYKTLIEPKISKRESYDFSDEDNAKLYDYLEHVKMSVIMAYTTVECFCNISKMFLSYKNEILDRAIILFKATYKQYQHI